MGGGSRENRVQASGAGPLPGPAQQRQPPGGVGDLVGECAGDEGQGGQEEGTEGTEGGDRGEAEGGGGWEVGGVGAALTSPAGVQWAPTVQSGISLAQPGPSRLGLPATVTGGGPLAPMSTELLSRRYHELQKALQQVRVIACLLSAKDQHLTEDPNFEHMRANKMAGMQRLL